MAASPLPAANLPASPWAQAPSRAEQRQAKRDAVLHVAAQMFNERGFHATSLDDIAARLNVTKPTLYYYVKNKDAILLACVKKGLDMTLEGIEASRAGGGNALDQLRACMRAYAEVVTQPFGMCLIRVGDEEVPEPSRTELRRLKSEIDHAFRRLVEQGVQEGVLAPCDPKMAAFVIAGALSWIGRWYQPAGAYSADQIIDQCTQLLLQGVLARPAQE
ncbi:HTH-type transcriptional repressor KstR2 [uncultured Comamonas sp.]|nr:HTH-type transcriptional repressor KstR2 [uncultured Comamonas sp.]